MPKSGAAGTASQVGRLVMENTAKNAESPPKGVRKCTHSGMIQFDAINFKLQGSKFKNFSKTKFGLKNYSQKKTES